MELNSNFKKAKKLRQKIFLSIDEENERQVIETIKKLPNIYSEIKIKKIALKTNMDRELLEDLLEKMIVNGDINGKIKDNVITFQKKA